MGNYILGAIIISIVLICVACISHVKHHEKEIDSVLASISKLYKKLDDLDVTAADIDNESFKAGEVADKALNKAKVHDVAIENLKKANEEILKQLAELKESRKTREEKQEECIAYLIEFAHKKPLSQCANDLKMPYTTVKRWWKKYKEENEL